MYFWIDFKFNRKFVKKKKYYENAFLWPTELIISIKQIKPKTSNSEKYNSPLLKLFFNYFSKILPRNYEFEVLKAKKRMEDLNSSNLFFQLPEGTTKYFENLNKILGITSRSLFSSSVSCQITYGACCIQDCLAKYMGFSIVFHYGHSCLVSILNCITWIIYIFIEIKYDFSFLLESIEKIFCPEKDRISLTSTIQFSSELKLVKIFLSQIFMILNIPQTKPLSPGEILGCTSYETEKNSGALYIGDGKFHVESVLLFNPNLKIVQFNPFKRSLVLLGFKFTETLSERVNFIENSLFLPRQVNLIFGILGRQGNIKILRTIQSLASQKRFKKSVYMATEIENDRLNVLNGNSKDLWIQLSCPRLSLDWGFYFKNILLTPFEFGIFTKTTKIYNNLFPMDFYSKIGKFWGSYSILSIQFKIHYFGEYYLLTKKYNYFRNFILADKNE